MAMLRLSEESVSKGERGRRESINPTRFEKND
jgi:hypothetical protein